MNLHEYQAKELLASYGLPVQGGILAASGDEAAAAYDQLGGKFAVIKAQVHAGGRGKAGGVKVVKSREEAKEVADSLIGKNLITYQTDANGQPVNSVLVCEDMYPVQTELYLGAVVDRSTRRVTFMASTEGGVEIEKVAEETPEKIIKTTVDPLVGLQPCQAREVAFALGLEGKQINEFVKLMSGAYRAFVENDFALFEINPLAVRENGELACVDGKIGIDSNALYRLPKIAEPATNMSAPASAMARILAGPTPPSTSRRMSRPEASIILRAWRNFSKVIGMNFWPPKPGLTLISRI